MEQIEIGYTFIEQMTTGSLSTKYQWQTDYVCVCDVKFLLLLGP